jgi:hypothetical protein
MPNRLELRTILENGVPMIFSIALYNVAPGHLPQWLRRA